MLAARTRKQAYPRVGMKMVLMMMLLLRQGYALGTFARQTFYDVIDAGGAISSSVQVERSQPFATHFVAAAGRCRSWRTGTACQALANLCALTLYAADHPACQSFQVCPALFRPPFRLSSLSP